jgi:hypothetical protein
LAGQTLHSVLVLAISPTLKARAGPV